MRFSTPVFALLAAAAAVSATPTVETNGERLARGLPPLPPSKRATPVAAAARGEPSGHPGTCNGHTYCCNGLHLSTDGIVTLLLGLLGIHLDVNVGLLGTTCTPWTPGVGSCSQTPSCCSGTNYGNGALISLCVELDIDL